MSRQNDIERLQDQLERGLISADEANVEMVRIDRVRLVTGKLPAPVRKALNNAVKSGTLGHLKKDGRKPEAYFHPAFDHMARQQRRDHEKKTIAALAGVLART